jgi:Dam-replacing family
MQCASRNINIVFIVRAVRRLGYNCNMAKTVRQELGALGERIVVQSCSCLKCKRNSTLRTLPPNFRCADLICDFCGYLAQVKAAKVRNVDEPPRKILGAAWKPQLERMEAGIYFPLFLVLVCGRKRAIYYLSADLQNASIFEARTPLSETARRAGWQGFIYRLDKLNGGVVRLL